MRLKEKKVILKDIVLNGQFDYDTSIYRLLNTKTLDRIIRKINKEPVPCNVNPKDLTSADEQFIQLLNRFIDFFKKEFPSLHSISFIIIENIILTNQTKMEKYLLSKHYLGDNQYIDFFKKSIYEIIVSNFIKNIKYIPLLKSIIKKENIKITNIDSLSLEDTLKIKKLLSDIVFCYDDGFMEHLLFHDIESKIREREKEILNQKKCNYSSREIKQSMVRYYNLHYEFMIEDYIRKRIYIKLFKSF